MDRDSQCILNEALLFSSRIGARKAIETPEESSEESFCFFRSVLFAGATQRILLLGRK